MHVRAWTQGQQPKQGAATTVPSTSTSTSQTRQRVPDHCRTEVTRPLGSIGLRVIDRTQLWTAHHAQASCAAWLDS